jgi:AraC family transcriptional regulator, arabinose operon regulatory protein
MPERIKDGFPNQRMTVVAPDVIARCRQLSLVQNLYVTDVGHFPPARHHYVDRPEGRNEHVLIFCVGGNGWCQINNHLWNIKEGSVFVIPGDTPHCYGAHEESPWTIYWVHFSGSSATQYLAYLGVSAQQPLLEVTNSMSLTESFEDMLLHVQRGYTDEALLLLSTVQAHLLALIFAAKKISASTGKHVEQRLFRSIRYMKANINHVLTLEQLANNVNMSSSHYSALFKQQISNSPIAFFNNLKMQRACELFNSDNTNIASVARDLGFEDSFYFSRIFKKIVGMPPSEYVKNIRKVSNGN